MFNNKNKKAKTKSFFCSCCCCYYLSKLKDNILNVEQQEQKTQFPFFLSALWVLWRVTQACIRDCLFCVAAGLISAGDELHEINGIGIFGMSPDEVVEMLVRR